MWKALGCPPVFRESLQAVTEPALLMFQVLPWLVFELGLAAPWWVCFAPGQLETEGPAIGRFPWKAQLSVLCSVQELSWFVEVE